MLSTRIFPLKSFGPALDEFWRSLDVQGHVAPGRADGKRRSGSESSTRLSCSTRLYVVVHQNPAHTVPHEISIPLPPCFPSATNVVVFDSASNVSCPKKSGNVSSSGRMSQWSG